MYTCIGSRENGNCYPPNQNVVYILPPTEGIRNSNGKGVQEEAISKGVGSDSQVFFSGDFETIIIVFIDDLTFNSYS